MGIYIAAVDDAFHRLALENSAKLEKSANIGASESSDRTRGAEVRRGQDSGRDKRSRAVRMGSKRLRGWVRGRPRKAEGRHVAEEYDDNESEDTEGDSDVSVLHVVHDGLLNSQLPCRKLLLGIVFCCISTITSMTRSTPPCFIAAHGRI